MEEIINRVANSKLKTFDLEDLYPSGRRATLDISQWLLEGFILKEKEFRASLKDYDWSAYEHAFVALHCSTDAIVPAWAYMLVTTYLQPVAKKVIVGTLEDLESLLYTEIIAELDVAPYENQLVIATWPEIGVLDVAARENEISQEIVALNATDDGS